MNLKKVNTPEGVYTPVKAHLRNTNNWFPTTYDGTIERIEKLQEEQEALEFKLKESPYPYSKKDKLKFKKRIIKIEISVKELNKWADKKAKDEGHTEVNYDEIINSIKDEMKAEMNPHLIGGDLEERYRKAAEEEATSTPTPTSPFRELCKAVLFFISIVGGFILLCASPYIMFKLLMNAG